MKHILSAAVVFTATLALAAQPDAVLAQSAGSAPAPVAAGTPPTPRAPVGVGISALSAWLASTGAVVEPVQTSGERRFLKVTTDGLPWVLFLQSCETDVCSDLQFSAALSDAGITPDRINAWNRDRRFVKAIYEGPGATGPASAIAQMDLLVGQGGPEQLADSLAVWRALLVDFVRTLMPPPAAAPATPPAGG